MVPLTAIPARLALDKFPKWRLYMQDGTEPKQVICFGYYNSSFDDRFMMAHWKKLEPDGSLEGKAGAENLFTANVQSIFSTKG